MDEPGVVGDLAHALVEDRTRSRVGYLLAQDALRRVDDTYARVSQELPDSLAVVPVSDDVRNLVIPAHLCNQLERIRRLDRLVARRPQLLHPAHDEVMPVPLDHHYSRGVTPERQVYPYRASPQPSPRVRVARVYARAQCRHIEEPAGRGLRVVTFQLAHRALRISLELTLHHLPDLGVIPSHLECRG